MSGPVANGLAQLQDAALEAGLDLELVFQVFLHQLRTQNDAIDAWQTRRPPFTVLSIERREIAQLRQELWDSLTVLRPSWGEDQIERDRSEAIRVAPQGIVLRLSENGNYRWVTDGHGGEFKEPVPERVAEWATGYLARQAARAAPATEEKRFGPSPIQVWFDELMVFGRTAVRVEGIDVGERDRHSISLVAWNPELVARRAGKTTTAQAMLGVTENPPAAGSDRSRKSRVPDFLQHKPGRRHGAKT